MYENMYPDAEDLVVVQVKNVAEMGAYVSLLEYDNIEGMILLSELSRRRIRSINKLIRVGRQEVVVVLRVDKEKGYIDLSKRRVSPEDLAKCEEKYNKSKAVHSIMRHVSETCRVRLIDLYEKFGWDLYRKYGHAYTAFKLIVTDPDAVLGAYEISDEVKAALLKNITRRLTPQALKIRADLEVTCFSYEGIDAIKEGLRAAEALSTPEHKITIKLVAPPQYVMMTHSSDKEEGIKILQDALDALTAIIKSKDGDVNVNKAPRAVSERDDRLLSTLMDELERKNAEVDGDEPTED